MVKLKVKQLIIKKEKGAQLDVYNTLGEVVEKISVDKSLQMVKPNPSLLSQYVRIYQANQRSGTHATKTRSQVVGSTRKIYRQKGTGRARHGDIKSPIFIGGGLAHGPHPRDYSLSMPKQMRKKAFLIALNQIIHGNLKIVKGLEDLPPKTKKLMEIFYKLSLFSPKDKKRPTTLLVTPAGFNNLYLAARNIEFLTIAQASTINTYDLLSHRQIIMTKDAFKQLTISPQKEIKIKKNKLKS